MKFFVSRLILWLRDNTVRTLSFSNNKVNVVTGDSGTGKSSIINIIDYCLLSSEPNISEENINEDISWYGIELHINDKLFIISRSKLESGKPSKLLYFSNSGIIPDIPEPNIEEEKLKAILEPEFSINSNLRIPYGGKHLKQGSKISFRYFTMFNTQSTKRLIDETTLFDKMDSEKYREALERIFPLAAGLETVKNVLAKDKIAELQLELNRLERKRFLLRKQKEVYAEEVKELCSTARALDLTPRNLTDAQCIEALGQLDPNDVYQRSFSPHSIRLDDLRNRRSLVYNKISKYDRYLSRYKEYRDLIKDDEDSLTPVSLLLELGSSLPTESDTYQIIHQLHGKLLKVREKVQNSDHSPIEINIRDLRKQLWKQLKELDLEIAQASRHVETAKEVDSIKRLTFLGAAKSKISLLSVDNDADSTQIEIDRIQNEIDSLRKGLDSTTHVEAVKQLLNERIQYFLNQGELSVSKTCRVLFDYIKKQVDLRKEDSSSIYKMPSIGSSSNYLFLHLAFFLGFHLHVIKQGVPFVPTLLILDQISAPYYVSIDPTNKNKKAFKTADDEQKLSKALIMLDRFISLINNELNSDFQIILLEHIPEEIWKQEALENFQLVDMEFRNGHKLINIRNS